MSIYLNECFYTSDKCTLLKKSAPHLGYLSTLDLKADMPLAIVYLFTIMNNCQDSFIYLINLFLRFFLKNLVPLT
jgi:hypothetical protein